MSWEKVIKVERDQQFPSLRETPMRELTVGDKLTVGDFEARGISEPFFDELEESFLNDIFEFFPGTRVSELMRVADKIEKIYDKLLGLEFLMYKKIPTNKKEEYLTDIKNKIVNEIFFLIIKPTLDSGVTPIPPYPPPNAPLKIYQDRPDIKNTISKPDPRLPKVGEEIEGYVDDPKQEKRPYNKQKRIIKKN